jgi:uncharacterized membrane protein
MKSTKNKVYLLINAIYIIVTAAINIYGYFRLPEEIDTQFSFSGESVNHMPKSIYLIISFFIVLVLALFSIKNEPSQKLKYLIINSIIFIANIIMIFIQL